MRKRRGFYVPFLRIEVPLLIYFGVPETETMIETGLQIEKEVSYSFDETDKAQS